MAVKHSSTHPKQKPANHTEQASLPELEKIKTIFAELADGITVQDITGKLIFANEIAAKLSGFNSAYEFLNCPPEDVIRKYEIWDEHGNEFLWENLPGRAALQGKILPEAVILNRVKETGKE